MKKVSTQIIKGLIETLDSTRFESLCYVFIDYVSGERLHHRGLNLQGEAVGYTVDSYSDDGIIVGEYSIEKTYFKKLDKKAAYDVEHAKNEFPNVQELYLCAGVEASPQQGINMSRLCENEQKKKKIHKIHWYDSRQMAEIIIEDIVYQSVYRRRLLDVIPDLGGLLKGADFVDNMPVLPDNFHFSEEVENRLLQMWKNYHILYINGISGVGKTSLAVRLQMLLTQCTDVNINNIQFLNAVNIDSQNNLINYNDDSTFMGINLLTILKNDKVILIFDDLVNNVDSVVKIIADNKGKDCYIIITSQLLCYFAKEKGFLYELKGLDFDSAKAMFLHELDNKGNERQFELLYNRTSGHPMLLNSIRVLMKHDGLHWDELEQELSDIADRELEDGTTLTLKLLKRHTGILCKEFLAIYWLQTKSIDKELLQRLILKEGISKLKKRSFLQELPYVYIIHDIVYECINSKFESDVTDIKQYEKFNDILYSALEEGIERKNAHYYRLLHLHENRILENARTKAQMSKEAYYYLQAYPNDEADILSYYNDKVIEKLINTTTDSYVYKSIFEWLEMIARKNKKIKVRNPGECTVNGMVHFDHMLSRMLVKDRLYADILHHKGKLYHFYKDDKTALNCFKEVIQLFPEAYESKLQIARIYPKEKKDERILIYCEIIDAYLHKSMISLSIVLAAYEDMVFYYQNEKTIIDKYFIERFDELRDLICSLSGTAFNQPYVLLANVCSRIYSYEHPEFIRRLLSKIYMPSVQSIRKNNYLDMARLFMEFGKALQNQNEDKEAVKYFNKAEYFYEAMDIENYNYNSFSAVKRAENLLYLREFDNALVFLDQHSFNDAFWYYTKSCVLLHLGGIKVKDALDSYEKIWTADKVDNKFYPTFYRKRAQIGYYSNEKQSRIVAYFDQAINCCLNIKFKEQIKKEREMYLEHNYMSKW